jgi:hypothetical protein
MSNITDDINYPKYVWEQLRRWRIARKPLLEALDIEFLRALETNDQNKIQDIISQKNQLRDITKYDFSTVESPEKILDVWPDILKSTQ